MTLPAFLSLPAFQLVRTVARRNSDDRTVSELIRLRDSLDRLGLLWTPLDVLDKYQSIEFARNLHVSTHSIVAAGVEIVSIVRGAFWRGRRAVTQRLSQD